MKLQQHSSLTEIPEGILVKYLMNAPDWRERIIGIDGIPSNAQWQLEVPLNGLPGDPKGDIDILLAPSAHPEFTTALQVKRVKVGSNAFRNSAPNKLQELDKLLRQGNLLAEIGFAQVYCCALVVVDSRDNNRDEFSYKGLTSQLKSIIERAISTSMVGLDDRVGFVHYELVQPVNDKPLAAGTYAANLGRKATLNNQPVVVTDWVRRAFEQVQA
jgi:hypothetical protein